MFIAALSKPYNIISQLRDEIMQATQVKYDADEVKFSLYVYK